MTLPGVVTTGLGHGARFMAIPWVRDAVRNLLGFDPYPGTFNVRLSVIAPDVTRHDDDLLELIAPVHVHTALGLRDHDRATLLVRPETSEPALR